MAQTRDRRRNLREACLREAGAIVEETGVEGLSLREVARRLGVSHQAPYKHFPSRDHLLAEIVGGAFDAFARHLDERPRGETAAADLAAMGQAYVAYARAHPLQYQLMFGTPLPDPNQHPEMMRSARHAFALLRDGICRLRGADGDGAAGDAELDALFVWSAVHGVASILESAAIGTLGLSPAARAAVVPHALRRVGAALEVDGDPTIGSDVGSVEPRREP